MASGDTNDPVTEKSINKNKVGIVLQSSKTN
jgi:hypothetical protein